MNCQNHPEIPATAYCRTCGKPVCDDCRRDALGTVYCAEHIPAGSPAPAPPPPVSGASAPGVVTTAFYPHADVSPGLALFLGFIPGVGAIYNGQYVKGLIHAVIFGIIISILDAGFAEPLFSMILVAWIFYMAFEAYHTARKRRMGEAVDEYSSLLQVHGRSNAAPVAGVVLVGLGALLLLHTLNLFDFAYLARYWPVLLIAAGLYLLYTRLGGNKEGV
jgi:TM2 domain-containing membrane protein YozV